MEEYIYSFLILLLKGFIGKIKHKLYFFIERTTFHRIMDYCLLLWKECSNGVLQKYISYKKLFWNVIRLHFLSKSLKNKREGVCF